jgi:microcystin-dependent protein
MFSVRNLFSREARTARARRWSENFRHLWSLATGHWPLSSRSLATALKSARRPAKNTLAWTHRTAAMEPLEPRHLLTTIVVDSGGGGDHTTIQAAVNAAALNDTIQINNAGSNYNESVDLNTGPGSLNFIGNGGTRPTVDGSNFPAFSTSGAAADFSFEDLILESGTGGTNTEFGIQAVNLTGTMTVTNVLFQDFDKDAVFIHNTAAVTTNVFVTSSQFVETSNTREAAVEAETDNAGATINVTVVNSTITNGGSALFLNPNAGTVNLTAIGNVITENSSATRVSALAQGSASFNLTLIDNDISTADGDGIFLNPQDNTTNTALIFNNRFVNIGNGSGDDAIRIAATANDSGRLDARITGNTFGQAPGNVHEAGIFLDGLGSNATFKLIIDNNDFSETNTGSTDPTDAGIYIEPDGATVNLDINNNSFAKAGTAFDGVHFDLADTSGGTVNLEKGASTSTDILTILQDNGNTFSGDAPGLLFDSTGSNGTAGGVADAVNDANIPVLLGDFVWNDLNGDGLQTGEEANGVSGVRVDLTGDATVTTFTSSAAMTLGEYFFSVLPGNYTVTVTPPAGKTFSPKDSGGDTIDSDVDTGTGAASVNIVAGTDDLTVDAGLLTPPSPTTTVTLAGTTLTIADTGGDDTDDTLTISVDTTPSPDEFVINDPNNLLTTNVGTGDGTNTIRVPVDSGGGITSIIVNTLSGDDTLTIDLTNDFVAPLTGIRFNGGESTLDNDKLALQGGGTFDEATHTFDNSLGDDDAGTVDITGNATITYTGLEPITDNLNVNDRIFDFTGGLETVTVNAAGTLDMQVDSTLGESVDFNNPNDSLRIRNTNGTGDDIINIDALGAGFDADLTIDGAGGGSLNFTSSNINTGTGFINAGGGQMTINVSVDLTTGGGFVGLNTDGSVNTTAGTITTTAAADSGTASGNLTVFGTNSISLAGAIDVSGADNSTGDGSDAGRLNINTFFNVTVSAAIDGTGGASTFDGGMGGAGATDNGGGNPFIINSSLGTLAMQAGFSIDTAGGAGPGGAGTDGRVIAIAPLGAVTMADGATINSGSADVSLKAGAGGIALSSVTTTGNVTLTSSGGSITDNTAAETANVTAGTVTANITGGAGTFGVAGAPGDINTDVTTLNVDTSGSSSGTQWIDEASGLTSLNLNAGTGDVALVAGGPVQDTDGDDDLTAAAATVTLSSGDFGAESATVSTLVWSDGSQDAIYHAGIDGSNPLVLVDADNAFGSGTYDQQGIATDGSFLYWADSTDDIYRSNLDGTGAMVFIADANIPLVGEPTPPTTNELARGLAVNSTHIYWADSGQDAIYVADINGMNAAPLIVAGDIPESTAPNRVVGSRAPYGLLLTSSFIYWADDQQDSIYRAELDGNNPEVLVDGINTTATTGGNSERAPRGVTSDATFLYWTDEQQDAIYRANLDGSNPEVLIEEMDIPFASGGDGTVSTSKGPGGPIVDGSFIYWADQQQDSIYRANLDGSNPVVLIDEFDIPQSSNGNATSYGPTFMTTIPSTVPALINTNVEDLTVNTAAGNGTQWIDEASGLADLNLNAGTGNVVLVAGDDVEDTAADLVADITAADADITVTGNLGQTFTPGEIDLDVDTLSTSTTGSQVLGEADVLTFNTSNAGATNSIRLDGGRFNVGSGQTITAQAVKPDTTATLGGTGSIAGTLSVVNSTGTISPGDGAGLIGLLTANQLSMNSGTFEVDLNGAATAGTDYDQVQISTVGVFLFGTPALSASVGGGYVPAQGDALTIIDNTTVAAVLGSFDGLPEGSTLVIDGNPFTISYVGGTGNDVVLTALGIPAMEATKNDQKALATETVSPGDTIEYIVDISNNGTATATGVTLTDPLSDPNLGNVSNIRITPIAFDDAYNASPNPTVLTVSDPALGILANDVDPTVGTGSTFLSLTANPVRDAGASTADAGTLTMTSLAAGTFTYTPAATATAGQKEVFAYNVLDAENLNAVVTGVITFNIFVPVNTPPEITSDGGNATAAVDAAENQTAVTDVQTNDDSDTEGAGLTYTRTTVAGGGADNGLFTLGPNGLLTFTAAPDFENPLDTDMDNDYEVQVTVTDSGTLTDLQDITVTVTPVNEQPAFANLDGAPVVPSGTVGTFVDDQTGFDQASVDFTFLGLEDLEGSTLPAGSDANLDDPLAPGVANGAYPAGTLTGPGVSFQSNTLGSNPGTVSPRGTIGLTIASDGFFGTLTDQISATTAGDSIDLLFNPSAAVDVTAVSFVPLFFDGAFGSPQPTDTITVRVYDASDNLLATSMVVGNDYTTKGSFFGVVSNGAAPIARINVDASNSDFEGADDVRVYGLPRTASVTLDNNVTISDPELDALNAGNGNYNGATLQIQRNGGADANDVFSNVSSLGTLTEGQPFNVGATTIGTVTTNSGGTLLLTFNNNATSALVDTAIQNIVHTNTTLPSSIQLDYLFSDGNAGAQGTGPALTATGLVTVNPAVANDDTYDVTGNVSITIDAANGVIQGGAPGAVADSGGASVTQVNGGAIDSNVTTAQSGTVNMAADGSFTYVPPTGVNGNAADTFTYTIAGGSQATVTIDISDMIWFIDNSGVGANEGTFDDPFLTIGDFNSSSAGVGDGIFLDTGGGNYSTAITLQNNQSLIGEGATGGTLDALLGITLALGSDALPTLSGTRPIITSTTGNGIDLASGNTVRGLNIGNTPAGNGVDGTSVGSSTISDVAISGTGGGVRINGGSPTFTFDSINSSGGTGIDISNTTSSTVDFGDVTVSAGSGDDGIDLNTNTGTFTFDSLSVTTSGGTGLIASSSGTVNINSTAASVNATNAPALDVFSTIGQTNGSAGWTFNSVTSTNSTTFGVRINGVAQLVILNNIDIDSNSTAVDHGIELTNLTGGAAITSGHIIFSGTNDGNGVFVNNSDDVTIQGTAGSCDPNDGGNLASCFEISGMGTGSADQGAGIGHHGVFSMGSDSLTVNRAFIHDAGDAGNADAEVDAGIFIDELDSSTATITNNRFTNLNGADALFIGDNNSDFSGTVDLTFSGNTVVGNPTAADATQAALQISFNSTTGGTLLATLNDNDIEGARIGFNILIDLDAGDAGNSGTGAGGRSILDISDNRIRDIDVNGISIDVGDDSVTLITIDDNVIDSSVNFTAQSPNSPIEVELRNSAGESPVLDAFIRRNDIQRTNGSGPLWANEGIKFLSAGLGDAAATGTIRGLVEENNISAVDDQGIRYEADEGNTVNVISRDNTIDLTGVTTGIQLSLQGSSDPSTLRVWLDGDESGVGDFDIDEPGGSQTLELVCEASCPVSGTITNNTQLVSLLTHNGNTSNNGGAPTVDATAGSADVIATGSIPGPSLQSEDDGAGGHGGNELTGDALADLVEEAISRWEDIGLHPVELEWLEAATFSITDMPDGRLGTVFVTHVTLDDDAGGRGWFIDPTPGDDSEFEDGVGPAGVDLLTAIMHEMGHVLGMGHGDGLLGDTLPDGIRISPEAHSHEAGAGQDDSVELEMAEQLASTDGSTEPGDTSAVTEEQLSEIVDAAIDRWVVAGLSADLIAAMESACVSTSDLPGNHLGSSSRWNVTIDVDAAGRGWFVDATPGAEEEFNYSAGSEYTAAVGSDGEGNYDLLTVVMHELGHVAGYADLASTTPPNELMTGSLSTGLRRLPDASVAPVNAAGTSDSTFLGAEETGETGGGASHQNVQPSLPLNYIIATQGVFPSQNGPTATSGTFRSANPFLGEVQLFAGNFAPSGWAFTDGQLVPISQNSALFSLLGTSFGGDGETTFGLPDLRGRVPVGVGTGNGLQEIRLGQKEGLETVTLDELELADHTHTIDGGDPTDPTGGNHGHENRQPFLGLNYIINLFGIFPSENTATGGGSVKSAQDFAGEIRLFAGNFAPEGWALAEGQLQFIAGNSALFSLLGTTYGGDGETTFGLPDTRGRTAIHPGAGIKLGEKVGADFVTLTEAQIPSHTHTTTGDPTGATGSGASHDNMMPSLAVNYIISTGGVFPTPNVAEGGGSFRGSDPLIAEVSMFGGNFAPQGWLTTDGQTRPIFSNNALFSLLGTTYGGDGETTFGLPNLLGRAAMHEGQGPGLTNRLLGQAGAVGVTTVTLTVDQMAAHKHTYDPPVTDTFDFGDAPDMYPVIEAGENGARHTAAGPRLGALRDIEADGVHSANADADDMTGDADEDGITFPSTLVAGATGTILVDLQNADAGGNLLDAWIDFNQDDIWGDVASGEQIFDNEALGVADAVVARSFPIPAGAAAGVTFARFRLSTAGVADPTGAAADGEVEDYKIGVAASGGSVTVNLPAGGGTTTVIFDDPDVVVSRDGIEFLRIDPNDVGTLTIVGTDADDDTLRIDNADGNPVPDGGLHFDGGAGGMDTLIHTNGTIDDIEYDATGEGDGELDVDGQVVTFENLEPVLFDAGTVNNVIIRIDDPSDSEPGTLTTTISDDGGTAGNTMVGISAGFESLSFISPANSFTLNGDDDNDDIINFNGVDVTWTAPITIDGQGGSDTVTFQNTANTSLLTVSAESVAFADSGSYDVEIGSTTAGNADTEHDQLDVTGAVNIAVGVTLTPPVASGGFSPAAGDSFIIINNDGADAVSGTFAGLPEGAAIPNFLGSAKTATISYIGGDGNDVVLTVPLAVVAIGDLPASKTVRIFFDAEVADPFTGGGSTVQNQGTVAGINFAPVMTDDLEAGGAADPTVTKLQFGSDPPVGVFLNEILIDPAGVDPPDEYVEIRGPASQSLDDVFLVFVEGDSGSSQGEINTAHLFDLTGTSIGSNGFLAIVDSLGVTSHSYSIAAGTTIIDNAVLDFENASWTAFLIHENGLGTDPTPGQDLDAGDDGLDALPTGWTILDGVSVLDGGSSDRGYADIVFSADADGLIEGTATLVNTGFGVDDVQHVMRIGDTVGSTPADWVAFEHNGSAPNFGIAGTTDGAYALETVITDHLGATNPTSTAAPAVNLSVSGNGTEAAGTIVTVTATAASIVPVDQTVSLAVTGTGVTGTDFVLSDTTITIPAGSTSGQVTFTVSNDQRLEGDETATLTISNPSSGITIGTNSQDVTIDDNETGVVDFIADQSNAESVDPTTNAVLTITGDGTGMVGLDVSLTISASDAGSGSAVAADLSAAFGTQVLTFATGDGVAINSDNATLDVNDDAVVESDETVDLTFAGTLSSSLNGQVTEGDTTHTITIEDNDSATISINDVTLAEGDAGPTLFTFTVTLDAQVDAAVSVNYDTANDSATTADNDYNANTGNSLTFAANSNAGTMLSFSVQVVGDEKVEVDETFFVDLSNILANGRNVSFFKSQGVGTIGNDDIAGFTVVETDGDTFVSEDGTSDTITVVLDAQPASDVVLDVTSGNLSEVTVDPSPLTFTMTDWDVPQTVTLNGVDDPDLDGDQMVSVTLSIDETASNDLFDNVADQILTVLSDDDDQAGIGVVNGTLLVEGTSFRQQTIIVRERPNDFLVMIIGGGFLRQFVPAAGIDRLEVRGKGGRDQINVNLRNVNDVSLDGGTDNDFIILHGATSGTDQVEVFGRDGHDAMRLFLRTANFVAVDGGAGNDVVVTHGSRSGPEQLEIFGRAGTDHIDVHMRAGAARSFLVDAGEGGDFVSTHGANGVILGGNGDDRLIADGSLNRNILIGGSGRDALTAHGQSILIAGNTTFDNDRTALNAILAEWNSPRSYADRVRNLNGVGSGPRLNGSSFLQHGVTVLDDTDRDTLSALYRRRDWFFFELGRDVSNRSPNEVLGNDLSVL